MRVFKYFQIFNYLDLWFWLSHRECYNFWKESNCQAFLHQSLLLLLNHSIHLSRVLRKRGEKGQQPSHQVQVFEYILWYNS